MTTLLISPDYLSHYFGLATLGHERRRRGGRVVVATGPALRERVIADGFEHVELRLGAEHNNGVASAPDALAHLRAFFDATRRGMAATVAYQVKARGHDMLWEPERVAARLGSILARLRPRHVVVDQLAFGATLALRALEQPFVSFLPSHPCQLPAPGTPYGFPVRFPSELRPTSDELAKLRALCVAESRSFSDRYNAILTALNPVAPTVAEADSAGSRLLTLVAYSSELAPDAERAGIALVGSVVREETGDRALERALRRRRPGHPTVYVSLGTFLSARADVLATIAGAVRALGANAVISSGTADPAQLGPIPPHWYVRPSLPQVALMSACDAVICHGGNNTVMEALTPACRYWRAHSPPTSSSRPRTCAGAAPATLSIPTTPAGPRSPIASPPCSSRRRRSEPTPSGSGSGRVPGPRSAGT